MNETTSLRRAPRLISIGGVLSGAAGGLGVVVLLQQFAVAYPTPIMLIVGIVVGILAHIAIVAAVSAIARGRATPSVPEYQAQQYEAEQYEPQPFDGGPYDERAGEPGVDDETALIQENAWAPTHTVPEQGLAAWTEPDPSTEPVVTLAARLPVQVVERQGDWASIVCENGWTGWVDARQLEAPL